MPRRFHIRLMSFSFLGLLTCSSLDNIEIEESSSTTIERGTVVEQWVGDIGFGQFVDMNISENESLKNQGVERHQIDSVYLKSLTLTVTTPATGQDFTFIDSLTFYAEAEGLPRVQIAAGGPFEAGQTTVGLNVDDVNLADYAASAAMDITSEVTGRRPDNTTTVRADIVIDVDVDVGGAICGE